ncbi:TIGR02449 family protein [Aliamphritea hakodatensis]|uniref:TIGR02449 family protein n=1 Tax=Aliamphritea hakodatensis TaxID=2895352 RepID=UPI0022FD8016|nr:TIGR02449 family protein [Aliamphritea hakodatensis]
MSEQDLRTLESQVEQLIQYCQRLELENRRLYRSETQLKEERNRLQQLHNDTRKRVDAMITRLKSLEQEA